MLPTLDIDRRVVLTLFMMACNHTPQTITLVPDAERARLDGIEKAVAVSGATLICPRPVLRGTPTPGRADDDIIAVDAPRTDSPLGKCVAALKKWKNGAAETHDDPPADVVAQCTTLPDAIARAVQHEDACSPYRPGRHTLDGSLTPIFEARALRVLIAQKAKSDPLGAAHIALDFMRLQADARRGPNASTVRGMLGVAAAQTLVDAGKRSLVSTTSLRSGDATELAAELATLEATDPPFSDIVYLEDGGAQLPAAPPGIDPSDVRYIYLLTKNEAQKRVAAACPSTANALTCWTAIGRASDEARAGVQSIPPAKDFSKTDPAKLRGLFMAQLLPDAIRAWQKEAVMFWLSRFDLRLARLQLWITQHHCPAVETITTDAGALALDPANDQPLILQMGEGGLTAGASAKLDDEAFATYRKRTYPIACTPPH